MSPLANMLVQIKNAQAVGLEEVAMPFSKMKYDIAMVLHREGYLKQVEKKQRKMKKAELPFLALTLGNHINGIKLVSKPSRRMYAGKKDLETVKSGYGVSVITTSKGIMTGRDARKAGVGGEVMFEIW